MQAADKVQGGLAAGTVEIIRVMMTPSAQNSTPPVLTAYNADVTVKVSLNLDLTIQPDVPNMDTSFSKGCIIWQPSFGTQSLYRFALANAGSKPVLFPSTTVNAPPNTQMQLLLNRELAIPWATVDGSITQDPDIPPSYSKARNVSGILVLKSDTTPTTATTFNGRFYACAYNDIRDINTANSSSGSSRIFEVTKMRTSCMTEKDYVEAPMDQNAGVVTVIGPDINPFLEQPNAQASRVLDGVTAQIGSFAMNADTMGNIASFGNTSYLTPTPPALPAGQTFPNGYNPRMQNGVNCTNVWYSPWGLTLQSAVSGVVSGAQPINLASTTIGDFSGVSIELRVPPQNANVYYNMLSAASTLPDFNGTCDCFELRAIITHVYGNMGDNGLVSLNVGSHEDVLLGTTFANCPIQNLVSGTPIQVQNVEFSGTAVSTSTTWVNGNWNVRGKYLGTQVVLYISQRNPIRNFLVEAAGAPSYYTILTQVQGAIQCEFNVRADNINQRGSVGPGRLIKWENVAPGQVLRVEGMLVVQAIPNGTTRAIIDAAREGLTAGDNNALSIVQAAYNDTVQFGWLKRVYKLIEYEAIVREFIDEYRLDVAKLSDMVSSAGPKVVSVAKASGLFSGNLAQSIAQRGAGFGSRMVSGAMQRVGQRLAGGSAGRFLQGAGRGPLGAAGQFGGMSSAGQFAAGQFGAVQDDDY